MSTGTPGTVAPAHGTGPGANRVLAMSTIDFTVMFAVWLMFGILGIEIQKELLLSDVELSWISALAVLNGQSYRVGQRIDGFLLVGISADAVVLEKAGKRQTLTLFGSKIRM